MKKVLVLFSVLAMTSGAADDTVSIRDGIRYKRALPKMNAEARGLVEACFTNQPYRLDGLFGSHVICGPNPWADLKTHPAFKGMQITPADIQIPVAGGRVQRVQGALLQTQQEIAAFCSALQDYLKSSDPYLVRRPTEKELQLYWAMIPYDISEPIFVAANKDHAMLLHFTGQLKVLWIGDLAGMSFGKQTGEPDAGR